MDLVLVDGANLYNSVASHLAESAAVLRGEIRSYLLSWFDLDRFVTATTRPRASPALGIVAFHSNKPLGAGEYRIKDQDVTAFWGRQAGLPHTSCMLVDVPGAQRETYRFDCEKCSHANEAPSTGEKGVDNAITVHMFESAGSWESACIFSRDADFVPTIWALRRRGKRVFVAAKERDRTGALGRASQSFFALALDYVLDDFLAFHLLRRGGVLDQLVANIQRSVPDGARCFASAGTVVIGVAQAHGSVLQKAFAETLGPPHGAPGSILHVANASVELTQNAFPLIAFRCRNDHRRPLERVSAAERPSWLNVFRTEWSESEFAR